MGKATVTSTTLMIRDGRMAMEEQYAAYMPIFTANPGETDRGRPVSTAKAKGLTLMALQRELLQNRANYLAYDAYGINPNRRNAKGPLRSWSLRGAQITNVSDYATFDQRSIPMTLNECHNQIVPNLWHPKPVEAGGVQRDFVTVKYRLWFVLACYKYDREALAADMSSELGKRRANGAMASARSQLRFEVTEPQLATRADVGEGEAYWAFTPWASAGNNEPPESLYIHGGVKGAVLRYGQVQELYGAHRNPPPGLYRTILNCMHQRIPVAECNKIMTKIPRVNVNLAI